MKASKNNRAKDTGLAITLLLLLITFYTRNLQLVLPAIVILLLVMIQPVVFHPLALLWFGLSKALGTVASTVILTLLFYLVITPMGLIRRIIGRDTMQAKQWRGGTGSVFCVRDHRYTGKDTQNPF
jgi:hypothetical protein